MNVIKKAAAAPEKPLTPREIVDHLDRHIVGQPDAKRAVAVAIRNRWRRQQLDDEMRGEVFEEAAQRMQNLEAVGAKVAHDLKNPLTSIKGLVQLVARKSSQDPRTERRLSVLLEEIERMERILTDYLSFSRPLRELRLAPVELAPFMAYMVELVAPRASQSGVVFQQQFSPVTLTADAERLKRVSST